MDRTRPQLLLGIWTGLGTAAVFVIWLMIDVMLGADPNLPSGISLEEQIALFLASGLLGGFLGGLLFPLTQWRAGTVALGMIVIAPMYLGQVWLADETYAGLGEGLAASVLVGGILGYWAIDPDARHTIVASKAEAPILRMVQFIGLAVLIAGLATCGLNANRDSFVSVGILLFGLGLVVMAATQVVIWSRRLLRRVRSQG